MHNIGPFLSTASKAPLAVPIGTVGSDAETGAAFASVLGPAAVVALPTVAVAAPNSGEDGLRSDETTDPGQGEPPTDAEAPPVMADLVPVWPQLALPVTAPESGFGARSDATPLRSEVSEAVLSAPVNRPTADPSTPLAPAAAAVPARPGSEISRQPAPAEPWARDTTPRVGATTIGSVPDVPAVAVSRAEPGQAPVKSQRAPAPDQALTTVRITDAATLLRSVQATEMANPAGAIAPASLASPPDTTTRDAIGLTPLSAGMTIRVIAQPPTPAIPPVDPSVVDAGRAADTDQGVETDQVSPKPATPKAADARLNLADAMRPAQTHVADRPVEDGVAVIETLPDGALGAATTLAFQPGPAIGTVGAAPQGNAIPLAAVPQAVATALQADPGQPVELRLDPPELGAVRFQMDQRNSDLIVTIIAERPETLDLMRRHAEQLLADLRQAGFAGASLNFGSSQGQGGFAQGHNGQSPDEPRQLNAPSPSAAFAAPPPPRAVKGGLNLRL